MKSNKPKILITGFVSLLGKYVYHVLRKDYHIIGTVHSDTGLKYPEFAHTPFFPLDITNRFQCIQVVNEVNPDILVHLASNSNIDYCESHPKEAYRVNVSGTENLLASLKRTEVRVIFLSSNAVFRGNSPPYRENDDPQPINVYGKTKVAATNLISTSRFKSAIIRSTSMFGWPPLRSRDNDLTYYLRQLKSGVPIHLVNDRFFNPVYALRVAQAIQVIINRKLIGIFHVAGKTRVNRLQFVKTLAKAFDISAKGILIPVASSFYPKLARRPTDATLATVKMKKVLGLTPRPLIDELRLLRQVRVAKKIP